MPTLMPEPASLSSSSLSSLWSLVFYTCRRSATIAATAALRCLLWAQFGPQSDGIIQGRSNKGPGEGYYTAESIFAVTPPAWEPEEQYGEIALVKKNRAPCRPWPFDRGSDAAELPEG